MKYSFYTTSQFDKRFKKLDRSVQVIIHKWINSHLIDTEDPFVYGKALPGNLKGYWKYRIGSYRLIVKVMNDKFIILEIDIDHSSAIYK